MILLHCAIIKPRVQMTLSHTINKLYAEMAVFFHYIIIVCRTGLWVCSDRMQSILFHHENYYSGYAIYTYYRLQNRGTCYCTYNTLLHRRQQLQRKNFGHTSNSRKTSIPRPHTRAIGIFCELFGEKWPRDIGSVLYMGFRHVFAALCCFNLQNNRCDWLPWMSFISDVHSKLRIIAIA